MRNLYQLMMFFLGITAIQAQSPADIDPSFLIGKSFSKSGNVITMALQPDGKIIAAGEFRAYDKITTNNIVRLNADGTLDSSFNSGTGFDSYAFSLAIQSDGKILVGGYFTTYNGTPVNYLARLNPNGSLDTTFNSAGSGFESFTIINSITALPSGKILLCGSFTTYNGTTANRILRLNSDGSIDPTFNIGTGFNSSAGPLALQSDGKILISGPFSTYNGTPANKMIRLNPDGTIDPTFNIGDLDINYSAEITIQPDNKILLSNQFFFVNGTSKYGLLRLNSDGSLDNTFTSGIEYNYSVESLALQADNKIIICGNFTTYNGFAAKNVARLNIDGTLDPTFDIGDGFNTGSQFTSFVNSVKVLSDGKILFAGNFTAYDHTVISVVSKVLTSGAIDPAYNVKKSFFEYYRNAIVRQLVEQPDGKIIAAGDFDYYFDDYSKGILRLNPDGTKDNTLQVGTGIDGNVNAVALQADGKIIVGGSISSFDQSEKNNLFRLNSDGTMDTSFNTGSGLSGHVNVMRLQPDGKILVAGSFSSYNGVARENILRLNQNGTLDTSFNITEFGTEIKSLAVQSDGKVLVGGIYFKRYNPDGHSDNTFNVGSGFSTGGRPPSIESINALSDGKIIVTGAFSQYNGTPVSKIVRLNSDGTIDNTFQHNIDSTFYPSCIAFQPNGKILLGANRYGSGKNLVRLNENGTVDNSFDGDILDYNVNSILVQNDKKIVVGGEFGNYDGTICQSIVRLMGDSTLSNEKFADIKFSFYPNPVVNQIKIKTPENFQIDNITITDLSGKSVLKSKNTTEINIEHLASGIYILNIYSGDEKWNGKFIKE